MSDKTILRDLVKEYASYASLPQQHINRENWKKLNSLQPVKPMVLIDQMPWNELNIDNELTSGCTDPFLRQVEDSLRRDIYKWKHMPADMVLDPFIRIPKAMNYSGYGVQVKEKTLATSDSNAVLAHEFDDLIKNEEELRNFKVPKIVHDKKETLRRRALCSEMFGDILPVYMTGSVIYSHLWDAISTFRGVTPIYMDAAEKPEFLKKIIDHFVRLHLSAIDQYEQEDLLEANNLIHCTGAYTSDLPGTLRGPEESMTKLYTKNCWTCAAAQLFASVSPDMHYHLDIEPMMPVYERFGLVYYGCCEALDKKLDIVKKIPNVRKISISAWADPVISAEQLQGAYVMSRKPSPAVLAGGMLDKEVVISDIKNTITACKKNGTNCEIILKDISTVGNNPQTLFDWEKAVRSTIESF